MATGKSVGETSAGRELEADFVGLQKEREVERRKYMELLEAQRMHHEELVTIRAEQQKQTEQMNQDLQNHKGTQLQELEIRREKIRREETRREEIRREEIRRGVIRTEELRREEIERREIERREIRRDTAETEHMHMLKLIELDSRKAELTRRSRLKSEKQKIELEERRVRESWKKKRQEKSIFPSLGSVLESINVFSTKVTRPNESIATVTSIAFQSLEEFLQSILGTQKPTQCGRSESRDQLRRIVQEAVAQQLKILDPGDESWLTELVGHNHSEEDNTQFIATLLVEYALNRPWVLHDELIKLMMTSTPDGLDAFGFDLRKLLIDPKNKVSGSIWVITIGKERKDLPPLPEGEVEHEGDLTTNLDALLGMAGFVPTFPEAEPGIAMNLLLDDIQDKTLNAFQSHVHFEKTETTDWANVSYLREKLEGKDCPIFDTIDCIYRAALRVEAGIHRLQRRGRCCYRLLFLRRPSKLGTGSTEADSISYIETASVELLLLQNFLRALKQQRDELQMLSIEAWEYEQWRYTKGVLSTIRTTVAAIKTGSLGLPFLSNAGIAVAAYESTAEQDPSRRKLLKLLPLAEAIAPILETLGIWGPDLENDSVLNLLHCVALAIQFLALAVQSYSRRFTTPMEFPFLDSPVTNFVLEGASYGNSHQKIFARPQELSCVGDMIGYQVLVFGKDMSLVEKAVDVDITAADLIEIWGPAKLAVVQKNIIQPARITGVEILGGILSPNNTTTDEKVLWHWERIDESSAPDSLLERTAEKGDGIYLDTRMRVGAIGQIPLNSSPERQKRCPRAGVESDLELRNCFRQSLSYLGAQDSALELKSTQAGLQGGQFVVPQLLWTWERSPGKSIKWNLLHSDFGFDSWIAELDNSWGLLVSLCTGVMKRARLRDLIAFIGPCSFHELIPTLPGLHDSMADDDFIRIFGGTEDLRKWIDGIVMEYCEKKPCQSTELTRATQILEPQTSQQETLAQHRAVLQEQIHKMAKAVLKNLQYTGVFRKDHLALAWLSPGQSAKQLRVSCQEHVWTRVLTDSSQVATFGCIGPFCFETPECPCRGKDWNPPKHFQLLTKVAYYTKYYDGTIIKQPRELQLGQSYWINSSDLNLLAKVRVMQLDSKSKPLYYYLVIKESLLDSKFRRHLDVKHMIREEDNQGSFSCVIGSGEELKWKVGKSTDS